MGQKGVKNIAIQVVVLAEFHSLAELGRIWQKRQIGVDCGKLRSHTQSLLTELVETGSGVL